MWYREDILQGHFFMPGEKQQCYAVAAAFLLCRWEFQQNILNTSLSTRWAPVQDRLSAKQTLYMTCKSFLFIPDIYIALLQAHYYYSINKYCVWVTTLKHHRQLWVKDLPKVHCLLYFKMTILVKCPTGTTWLWSIWTLINVAWAWHMILNILLSFCTANYVNLKLLVIGQTYVTIS